MVFSSNCDKMPYEYPLKILEIEDFLYNSDDFLWRRVSKTSNGIVKVKNRIHRDSYYNHTKYSSEFNYEDFHTNASKIPRNLTDSTEITLVFTESQLYRQHFEKTHLKLINNMVVFDSKINFFTIDDARKFYELLLNSKRWLFHGIVKKVNENTNKDFRRKSKFSIANRNNYVNNQQTDILLILNSSQCFVRDQLIRGFKSLIKSFSTHTKSVFEIDFEKCLSVFYARKIAKSNMPSHKYEIKKSKITFTSSPSHISALLNNSQHSLSSFLSINKPKKIGELISRFKNTLAQKVQKVSNSSPTIYKKFSFEILPHLLCFLDENKTQVNYISYNDEKFFTIINHANNLQQSLGSFLSPDKLVTKKNSSGSDWSWSVNSSVTGFSSSKSFDCLTDKNLSAYETDFETDFDKDIKYLNRSLFDVSQSPDLSKYQKGLYVKNANMNKSKNNKIVNEFSSASSSLSSISNYLNKKKKTSGSSDIISSSESEKLLNNDMDTSICDSEKFEKTISYINFELGDFKPCINDRKQKVDMIKKSAELENSDEIINRHPALVRSALRSKSADLLGDRSNNKKTILKAKSNLSQNLIDLDYEEIEETTKKNTFLNSQILLSQTHSSRRNQNTNYLPQVEQVISKAKIYQQNIKPMQEFNHDYDSTRKSRRSSSKTMTYTRCCSKQRPKKSYSPPPPIYISPTGLLAPPPVSLIKKSIVENNKENYDNKIKFYEIRNKFETVSKLNSQPINRQTKSNISNQKISTKKNLNEIKSNYNHLNFKIGSYL